VLLLLFNRPAELPTKKSIRTMVNAHWETSVVALILVPLFLHEHHSTNTDAFQPSRIKLSLRELAKPQPSEPLRDTRRFVSSSAWTGSEFSNDRKNKKNMATSGDIRSAMSNITASYMESMSMETDVEDQEVQERLDQRSKVNSAPGKSDTFRVSFDLTEKLGFSLVQVSPGRKISNSNLDLDQFMGAEEATEDELALQQKMDWPTVAGQVSSEFKGLLVSSVTQGSAAWEGGVRAGDVLTSASATLGDALWPTSTLDGIQSALRSRKVTSPEASVDFIRIAAQDQTAMNQYQLTLQRPLGIEVQEEITKDGDAVVVVTGFSENAPNLVRHAVQIGDRVMAVDSSLGGSMWPVTTVAGLTSACTSRLPGAPVTLQMERPLENLQTAIEYNEAQTISPAAPAAVTTSQSSVVVEKDTVVDAPANHAALLERCRNVLERYSVQSNQSKGKVEAGAAGFKGKYDVPAIVADKVVDALASSRVSLDSVTLSMIMRAYLSCNRADSALRVFEAAVGFRADGSWLGRVESLIGGNGGGFVPRESALNIYTGTALLQAHAMKGDLYSVSRVLAALEGRSGVLVNGIESAPWPFTGSYGSIQPDTKCYNIAMAAAAKVGGEEGLEMALAFFDSMANTEASSEKNRKPVKNAVSYNTIINALSNAGRSVDAFRVFGKMQEFRVKPTKYTYTPLIKACLTDNDIQELLYDMTEKNIKGDTVTYNTMIRSLCEKRRWTEASRLVEEMESRGVAPDSMTYGYLMSAMLRADKPTACLTLFESAVSSSKTAALTENVYLYTTAITAASVLGDFERAIDLLSRMTAKGVKPNVKTLTSVAGACLAAGQPILAAQIYRKIDTPDGYAMSQGLQALSGSGAFSEALELIQSQNGKDRLMTGKQVMQGYQHIVSNALKVRDFAMAEAVFADFLKKGYIPNKGMLFAYTDALGFSDQRGLVSFSIGEDEDKEPMFRFALYVLDALRKRNLPVESYFYSVTLFLGAMMDGSAKTIAGLVARAKVSESDRQLISNNEGTKTSQASRSQPTKISGVESWVHLMDNFDDYDLAALKQDESSVPAVQVRVTTRDRRRLMRAENVVSFSTKNRKRQKGPEMVRS